MSFQLHVSGLGLLSRCGQAFYYRYIERAHETKGPSQIVGTAVDRAVSADLTHKKDAGRLLVLDAVHETARDALMSEWQSSDVRLNDEDAEDGWTAERGDAVDAAVALAGFHHIAAAPALQPIAVQRSWVMDVQGAAIPLQIAGTIDIEELGSIRDTKTSAKSPKKTEADESMQLTMYSFAKLRIDGALPLSVALDYVVRTPKRKELKFVPLVSRRREEDMGPLAHRIISAGQIIKSGLFMPADPSAWWCSKKYCSFWGICPYAVRPVSVSVPEPDLEQQLSDSLVQIEEKKDGNTKVRCR